MTWRILIGDVRDKLGELPDESVHCAVTSPPYWGLRDYGTARWEGGEAGCDHSPNVRGGRFATPVSSMQASNAGSGTAARRDCPCGAIRIDAQLGLERTSEEYVDSMVAVFREVRRVLRSDGTLWLNLGDSYAAASGGGQGKNGLVVDRTAARLGIREGRIDRSKAGGLKPKDLVGIPWRVAFALQADGWWLRSDIIWAKPNPMPESVTDRPTKAHEYVFLLTKSARYFWDADAVKESAVSGSDLGLLRGRQFKQGDSVAWHAPSIKKRQDEGVDSRTAGDGSRNIRTVWTINPQPFPEAHFATFPEALVEPCILAGCPKGGTVLDPFSGSGTTLLVAERLGRDSIGIELNPEYAAIAERRIRSADPMSAKPLGNGSEQGSLFA